MKKILLGLASFAMLFVFSAKASAQEAEVVQEGVASTYLYVFYVGEHPIDFGVPFKRYSDGTIVFPGLVNGMYDIKAKLGETDEYGRVVVSFEEGDGGHMDTFSYAAFDWWTFDVYRFTEPVDIVEDKMDCLFVDGSSYYEPEDNFFVFDYISAVVDEEEYQLIVDFSVPYEGNTTTGVKSVSSNPANEIYNLAGQRMDKMQKGLNIVGGKKILVK